MDAGCDSPPSPPFLFKVYIELRRKVGENTRNIVGSYLASDFKLAARFALVNYRDVGEGIVVVIDKSKLPDLKNVDPGNYVTSYIPIESVTKIIDLKKL